MMLVKTYIAPSGIEGNGIYAGESIKKGQVIWEMVEGFDVEFSAGAIEKLPQIGREYVWKYSFPHPHKPGIRILDGDSGRFMNHSDAPNTDFSTPDNGTALVDIAQGEEITCSYHEFNGEIDF